jgi:LacI family transcriptional regulator
MTKRATITDVAKKAGVSVATVSRYFAANGYPVSKSAGERIDRASEELQYTPNIVGRMLKTNSSRDIGVIIPTIMNPFYPDVLLGIEKTAAEYGYQILLCNSLRNPEAEKGYIDSLYQKQVRGIIIAGAGGNLGKYSEMKEKGMHVVNLEEASECCLGIGFDFIKSGRILASHLSELGHTNIAFLTSPLTKKSRKDVLRGIREIIAVPDENIIIDDNESETEDGIYEYEMGISLSERFLSLKDRPTAVIAVNDITAAGVIKGLSENGISVPDDVSVAGFDNIALSSMITPSLTTVDQPGFKTGEVAALMLIAGIEDRILEYEYIEPELIIRASTSENRRL